MKRRNILIFGSTGMLGSALLIEALESESIENVLLINRKPVGLEHSKLTEVIRQDFSDFSSLTAQFKSYDACCFCLGTTSLGKNEETYSKITYDITKSAAKAYHEANSDGVFLYISGVGTDSSEKGRTMWANVKGRTENMLIEMFNNAYMFRPGFIQPLKGVVSSTNWYRWLYKVFGVLYPILKKLAPNSMMTTVDLSQAMLNAIHHGYHRKILEPVDIIKLAESKD
jgi:uncharacterized protein YbjT (DUF2867 family)